MYTILIVDDERPAQTFLKAICQKYCPAFDTILLSGSADDALRLMAQQHVHVLVTDISMPGINGIELAQRVRQLYPRTHTVIVSGYAEFEFARGAIQAGWIAFYGRDEQETILLRSSADRQKRFPDELSDLLKADFPDLPCTAIYAPEDADILTLPQFLSRAAGRMVNTVVISKGQLVPLNALQSALQPSVLSAATKKRLASFVETGNTRMLKELFVSLAIEWNQNSLPQIQAEDLCYQLILYTADLGVPGPKRKREQILREANELYGSASSYGDLLASLYSLIFEEGFIRDKNVSANELCEYTLNYIRENYAQPLSIPRICTDVGISQTYLSRLLRKYAGTTFNTFLTQCRMDAAKQMLRDHPDILLHEVAACVGYDDQSYFSKIFRNETGMTPSQYAATFAADAPTQPPKT